jgi:oxygen-dependent protoporphyrinogen oxidase
VGYAVVGGGITGLAAAWELRQRAPDADITVFEPGVLGGKLRTSEFAGRRLDEGADAFLARVPEGRQLCEELGLADGLVTPATGRAYVAAGRQLHALPTGLVLGVPTDPAALAGSPLVGPDAADRVAAEPGLGGAPLGEHDDPSIGSLIRARFGDDVLERLVDPLLGGINAGDTDQLSLRAAAPQLAAAAERSGSLVEGLRAAPPAADPTAPVFWALPGGMATLVDALLEALAAAGVTFRREVVDDLGDLDDEGVVLATPAAPTARLAARAGASRAAAILGAIRHASPVMVSLAFRADDVRHPLDGSGLLVPKPEHRMLTACSFASTKWAHLARPDSVVLRASSGRHGDDRAIAMDDDVLVASLLGDLHELIGLGGDPIQVRVNRWRDGFPQYEPGHLDRVAVVEADLAEARPGVALAGAAHRGLGIPACIRQGRAAARVVAGAGGATPATPLPGTIA